MHTHACVCKYHIDNRIMCVCVCVHLLLNVIRMIFTLSHSELHRETIYAFLLSKALSFLFVPARIPENDFIWEATFLISCRARSTLTYGSTKAPRLRHPARVVLLLTPVYQIIGRQAAFL